MITQAFLVATGSKNSYPSYNSNLISLSLEDPSLLDSNPPSLTSPLFSIDPDGYSSLPEIKNDTKITFYSLEKPFPHIKRLIDSLKIELKNEVWFAIGLSNLVVIDNSNSHELSIEIEDYVVYNGICIARETWLIDEYSSISHPPMVHFYGQINGEDIFQFHFQIPENLLLHEKFVISEFKMTSNKLLSASYKFTPQYFKSHRKILIEASELVTDLFILRDNSNGYEPSEALETLLKDPENSKEEILNDTYGRIVQLNSSLSYVYSQVYSGALPIFDHIGIVRRHSMLGVGTAINALYELLFQLEELFLTIPFEKHLAPRGDSKDTLDNENRVYIKKIPDELSVINGPSLHEPSIWNKVGKAIVNTLSPDEYIELRSQPDFEFFYNRFAFFSGRLGFREYDFTATAAIQVLIEAKTLRWNVVNYTHEIIHNHVRIILNEIIAINRIETEGYVHFIDERRPKLIDFLEGKRVDSISMNDYFFMVMMSYCVYSQYHGSLSEEWDKEKFDRVFRKQEIDQLLLILPVSADLVKLIKSNYRDISEIFVHILDFAYIYKKDSNVYLRSIWNSWATVPMVSSNLMHYVLRSLLVFAVDIDKDADDRFDLCVSKLRDLCRENRSDSFIFDRILQKLNFEEDHTSNGQIEDNHVKDFLDLTEYDLRYRFQNCVMIADLAYSFFVANVEEFLDRGDDLVQDNDLYGIESLRFEKVDIKSKLRLVTSELIQSIKEMDGTFSERDSSWLLLAIGSKFYTHG